MYSLEHYYVNTNTSDCKQKARGDSPPIHYCDWLTNLNCLINTYLHAYFLNDKSPEMQMHYYTRPVSTSFCQEKYF